ncbi:MAG TPA: adenosylmethionine--8-amino-7-oxononanoate transaminase [Terriglobia bacterium]|nr:adenosylmethionine--8-amino-7-oxononanoate transaminase [Terriglobia bacterium]
MAHYPHMPPEPHNPLSIWHPYTHPVLDPPPVKVKRAEGVYLYTESGARLIDAISSWWVTLHGHGHPKIVSAVQEQAQKLDQVIYAGFTHEKAEELAIRLREVLPASLEHLFFSDDGSTAVEAALKMAVQFWHNQGRTEKKRIIALEHAYHGDTAGAMSVSAESNFTEAFRDFLFPILRAHSAYCFRCPVGKTRDTCSIDCAERLETLLEKHSGEVAAVIVEPLLQGAGGMIVHPPEFLCRVREITRRYGVLLIADEVLTGFGRCGRMFACEIAGVEPDLMCLSKGITGGFLPLGATVSTRQVFEAFRAPGRRHTFFHGHSYTCNPLACAAAVANLEIFRTEPVFERVAAIERVHREQLARFQGHPAAGDLRRIGTIAAIELRADDPGYLSCIREKLYPFFLSRGVLLRPLGNVIYILPPFAITPDELRYVYDVIGESLELLA